MIENEKYLYSKIDNQSLPKHVAIIMDGNGRWAKRHNLPRIRGHRKGTARVKKVVTLAKRLGVKVLTLYAFSSENWKRPTEEINLLMDLLYYFLIRETPQMVKKDIQLVASGDLERLPTRSRLKLFQSIKKTQHNKGMILNLALNYGGRNEIVRACKFIARDVLNGKISEDQIAEESFARYLYNPQLPDPDLVIRTSGESRISNFLLWEIAYSELYITKTLWPDFSEIEFLKAIINYQNRERRFGGI